MMFLGCGLSAGLLGGYLGLGGGILMVPYLTVIAGVDIKTAVAVSLSAIVASSFTASTEFLKKGMVDLELAVILSLFGVIGNITGSQLSPFIPAVYVTLLLSAILVYSAFSLIRTKNTTQTQVQVESGMRRILAAIIACLAGFLAALVGIGGGVILVPLLFLVLGLPLSKARGTSSLIIGFSAAAATAVYYMSGQLDPSMSAPVILGIIPGARLGGMFGTRAKPKVVKWLFFIIMIYLAVQLSYRQILGAIFR